MYSKRLAPVDGSKASKGALLGRRSDLLHTARKKVLNFYIYETQAEVRRT